MEMEGMEGAILIFMLGNMEQTVARKQTKREKNNTQKRTEGWKQKGIWLFWYAVVPVFAFYLMECYEHNPFAEVRVGAQLFNIFLFVKSSKKQAVEPIRPTAVVKQAKPTIIPKITIPV